MMRDVCNFPFLAQNSKVFLGIPLGLYLVFFGNVRAELHETESLLTGYKFLFCKRIYLYFNKSAKEEPKKDSRFSRKLESIVAGFFWIS